MTRDEAMRLAEQAGVEKWWNEANADQRSYEDAILRLVMLATKAEREACAAICDELESFWSAEKNVALLNGDVALSNASSGEPRAARAIAQAIRARGEK